MGKAFEAFTLWGWGGEEGLRGRERGAIAPAGVEQGAESACCLRWPAASDVPRAHAQPPERETEALRAGVVVGSLPGVVLGGGGAGPIMQRMWAPAPSGVRMCAGPPRLPRAPGAWRRRSLSSSSSSPSPSVLTQRRGRCGVRARRLRLRRLPSTGRVPSKRPRDRPRRRRGWRRRSSERPLWPAIQALGEQSGCLR